MRELIIDGNIEIKSYRNLKESYQRVIKDWGFIDKPPFKADPMRYIGGTSKLYAEKRKEKIRDLLDKLNLRLKERFGDMSIHHWMNRAVNKQWDLKDF